MVHDSPSQEAIVRVTDIPATGDGPQKSIATIGGAEHADILLVVGGGALPRDALEIGRVKGHCIKSLASARIYPVAMEDGVVEVRFAGVADGRGFTQEAEVPL